MRITSAGNVGIGTTNPVLVDLTGTSKPLLQIRETSNSGGQLRVGGGSDGTVGLIFDYSNSAYTTSTIRSLYGASSSEAAMYLDSGFISFRTGTSFTERMRITPAGDICAIRTVNGLSASYKNLSFGAAGLMARDAYDSYFVGNLYYDAAGWKLKYANFYGNCVNWYAGEYSFQRSTTAGTADSTTSLQSNFYLDVNGNATFRGTVTPSGTPSDINLKENLVKITSPLEKILQINGYNFDWKAGTPSNGLVIPVAEGMQAPESPLSIVHDAGLIAQEVEAIMPQLVRDNGHKALNYNGIIALLVEGMKEQQALITALQEKLERNNII
jgi:hypothetical protein